MLTFAHLFGFVCLMSFCLCRTCVRIHESDKVSPCVRMKDLERQIERKRKRQIEGRKNIKLLMSACLLVFVCIIPVCM